MSEGLCAASRCLHRYVQTVASAVGQQRVPSNLCHVPSVAHLWPEFWGRGCEHGVGLPLLSSCY